LVVGDRVTFCLALQTHKLFQRTQMQLVTCSRWLRCRQHTFNALVALVKVAYMGILSALLQKWACDFSLGPDAANNKTTPEKTNSRLLLVQASPWHSIRLSCDFHLVLQPTTISPCDMCLVLASTENLYAAACRINTFLSEGFKGEHYRFTTSSLSIRMRDIL